MGLLNVGPKYGLVKINYKQRPIYKKGPDVGFFPSRDNKTSNNSSSLFSKGSTTRGRQKVASDICYDEQSMEYDIVRCNNKILENFVDGGGRLWREIINLGVVSTEPQMILKRRIRDLVCSSREGKKGVNRASK